MDHTTFLKQFALGAHLCREPMPPMRELKRDMQVLKKAGFNLVKLQEHWMLDEPVEGQTDFSRYAELIEFAAGLDLGVYLGLTCEQAPGWLFQKHPGCRMVGRDGRAIIYEAQSTLPADGKPGPCFDHPEARVDQLRFIRKVVEELGRYENVVVWNTWQEIGYWSRMTVGQEVCYCEHTLAAFRRWLEERYGDLDGLNHAWNTRYGDWRFVQPDRGAYGQVGLPQDIDWRYFMDNVQVTNVLRERAEAIRQADPLHRPVFAHKAGMSLGFAHDWEYARAQDFLAASCYPAWNPYHAWDDRAAIPERREALTAEMVHGVALTFDTLRSCNPPGAPIWAAEFQGGPVSQFLHLGRTPSPEDIRRWMLTAVGAGATGISFWNARAERMALEMNGFGLLDGEGDSTPRFREAARVGAALQRHAELFAQPSWGGAEVGILVNEWNAQLASACPPAGDHLGYSTRGWHRLLWELGVAADFVNAAQVTDDLVNPYRVLVLPFPLSLSEDVAQKIGSFVYAGGGLICEAVPGRLDEHGMARPGEISPIFSNLFGARQTGLRVVREPGADARWTPPERTWGEFIEGGWLVGDGPLAGVSVPASLYVQTFELQGSQPVLKFNGRPAGTFRVGRYGWAWLVGTLVGHSATAHASGETRAFVKRLLELCNVRPAHEGRLLLRVRSVPGKQAWFLTNPQDEPVTETLEVGDAVVKDLLDQPFERSGSRLTLTVAGLDVRVLVLSQPHPPA